MNIKVSIGNTKQTVSLNQNHYLASGGEAAIYVTNGMAYKLYHDPVHKQLPPKKMAELSLINNSQVVVPRELIYDPNTGTQLGYTTKFIAKSEPLLKLFTRTFKDANGVTHQMINNLVKEMQLITADVHAAQCLIVDLNELNVLAEINGGTITPWFIDTDSYSTPSFKATAIMDSVRDRKVTVYDKNGMHYRPTIESDWFSWSILAFWLYSNIHPYRGNHPNYKPKDKQKQMDDGISVFHSGVKVPPSVNDFKLIPARHLDWFKRVFEKGERGIPPMPDSNVPLMVPTQIITIKGTDKLDTIETNTYSSQILDVRQFMGIYYVVTKSHVYANKKEIGNGKYNKANICFATDGSVIVSHIDYGNQVTFKDLTKANPLGTAISNDMFVRNNAVYTMNSGKLVENSFTTFGSKIIHNTTEVENISTNSSKMYDGCVIQDLLGKPYLTLPYKLGSCFSKHISQLDGYRIIDAKADKNVVVIIGEKKGQFDRFILVFDKTFTNYNVRKVDDVTYDTINFCVMDNGLCVLLASQNELELFVNTNQCEVINDPPFDSTMKLFSTSDGIFFVNGNSIHQLKKK